MSEKTLHHKPVNSIYLFFLLRESTEKAVDIKKKGHRRPFVTHYYSLQQ